MSRMRVRNDEVSVLIFIVYNHICLTNKGTFCEYCSVGQEVHSRKLLIRITSQITSATCSAVQTSGHPPEKIWARPFKLILYVETTVGMRKTAFDVGRQVQGKYPSNMTSGPSECERKRNLLSSGLMRCAYGAT